MMALGKVFSGSLASAAAVPISSVPTKEKIAIWNPARKPRMPCGMTTPGATRWLNEAVTPAGEV
ncbi:hypothetical protein D3C76_1398260 [compost metagenome]